MWAQSAAGGDGHLGYVEELVVLPGCPSRLQVSHKTYTKLSILQKTRDPAVPLSSKYHSQVFCLFVFLKKKKSHLDWCCVGTTST